MNDSGDSNTVLFLAKEVVPFVWKKHALEPVTLEKLGEALNLPLNHSSLPVEDLRKDVWVRVFVTLVKFRDFMKMHYDRMVSSFEMFAQYAVHACFVAIEAERNPYDRFLTVFAILTYFSIYVVKRKADNKNYVQIIPDILTEFFIRELLAGFKAKGNWNGFCEHLKRSPYLEKYDAVGEFLSGGKKASGVCQEVLKEPTDQRMGNKVLKDITLAEVEGDKGSRYIAEKFKDYRALPISTTGAKKKKKTSKSTDGGDYVPLPQISDDGPSVEFVEHVFGKQFTFIGDNVVYCGLSAREAILNKAKECLALIYDEIDFTNFLIDMALKDLEEKVAETKLKEIKKTRNL